MVAPLVRATMANGRLLPTDFPPVSTVQHHFYRFRDEGLFDLINDALSMASRVVAGRDAAPTAGIIPSRDHGFAITLPGSGQPVRKDDRKRRAARL